MKNDLLYQTLRIRKIEEAIANEYHKQEMRQPVHLDIGAEWSSVVICSHLEPHDAVFGTHRSHSQFLACGGSVKDLIAGLMGKNDLSSMHLSSDGIFKASGSIVGGIIPVAVGAAWAKKLKKEPGIVVCFLGDGATEEGVLGESLNFSALHQLPILFVVQNNGLAVTTPIAERHKYDIYRVATAYGVDAGYFENYVNVLTNEFALTYIKDKLSQVRQGKPKLIEFFTERQRAHCGTDHEYVLQNDVLAGYNVNESEINKEIEEAFEFARQSPAPTEVRGIYSA